VCGLDGCTKAYGSASSLCAHKRAHHPGWRNAPRPAPPEKAERGPRVLGPVAAAQPGAQASQATARGGPAGAWIAMLASDAVGRLGTLRRSRIRSQRACREETSHCAALAAGTSSRDPEVAAAAAAEITVRAAAARLCRAMDLAIDEEVSRLEQWVARLDTIAAECIQMGSARFFAALKAANTAAGGVEAGAAFATPATDEAAPPVLEAPPSDSVLAAASAAQAVAAACHIARTALASGARVRGGRGGGGWKAESDDDEAEAMEEAEEAVELECPSEQLTANRSGEDGAAGGSPAASDECGGPGGGSPPADSAPPSHNPLLAVEGGASELGRGADDEESGGDRQPNWAPELAEQLGAAGAVGDALALGDDAETVAATWPREAAA